MDDRVADGLAEDVSGPRTGARHEGGLVLGSARAERQRGRRWPAAAAPAGIALSASGPSACARAERDQPARGGDGGQEDRVEDDQEAQQRARGRRASPARRAAAPTASSPRRRRRRLAASAWRPRRRASPARSRAVRGARWVVRWPTSQNRVTSGEGEQLEDGAADDPARIGIERAAQRVSEGCASGPPATTIATAAAAANPGGHGGPARECAHVDARDGEFGVGLAEGGHQDYCRGARPSVSLGLLTCRSPGWMHAGPDTTSNSKYPSGSRGSHSGAIHRPGVRRAAPPRRISAGPDPPPGRMGRRNLTASQTRVKRCAMRLGPAVASVLVAMAVGAGAAQATPGTVFGLAYVAAVRGPARAVRC